MIDRMKTSYGNFFIQSQSWKDFLARGKSVSSNQKSAVEMIQSVRNASTFTHLFNLHSQKFLEFPQVFTSFLAN